MKISILLLLTLFSFLSYTFSQNLRKVPETKEIRQEKLFIPNLNREGVPAAELSESFESENFPPADWAVITDGGSGWNRLLAGSPVPGWSGSGLQISTPPQGGNAVAYCTYSNETFFNDQWLVTPLILDIQPTDTLFFSLRNQVDFADSIYIYYSLNGFDFNFIGQVFYEEFSADTNWGRWFIPIGSVITQGSDIFIGFREFVFNSIDNGGAISLDLVSVSGINYPDQITLTKTFTFGDVSQSASYRMIGLPGDINLSLVPPGTQKTDWNMFLDNGTVSDNSSDYLVEYNGQPQFNFQPGRGFWTLSRNPIVISQQVNTVDLNLGGYFIPLHDGFNIISNPFETNVSAADIRDANGLPQNAVFYNFNGSFPAGGTNTLVPYEGYYFNNDASLSLLGLFIPYSPAGINIEKTSGGGSIALSGQHLKISVSHKFQKEITIGFDPAASNDFDNMDYFAPPDFFEDVSICLYNNNLKTNYKNLFVEHRTEIGEGQIFNLKIRNNTESPLTLSAAGLENFDGYEIYLLDERLNKLYNLRGKDIPEISPLHKINNYSVLIGSTEFINLTKDDLIPDKFSLSQNYPNPFNPYTNIMYSIPDGTSPDVSLKIYDILGNEVSVLVNEKLSPGIYETRFDGTSLSSGIYFIKMTAGAFKEIRKMTLIK